MSGLEKDVKREYRKFLDSLGDDCWYYSPVPMGYGRKGVPDDIGCYLGQFFSIEAKKPGGLGTMTEWQIRENTAIENARGVAIVADNVGLVKQAFRQYLNWKG